MSPPKQKTEDIRSSHWAMCHCVDLRTDLGAEQGEWDRWEPDASAEPAALVTQHWWSCWDNPVRFMETQQVVNGCDILNTLLGTPYINPCWHRHWCLYWRCNDIITIIYILFELLGIGGKVPFGSLWLVPFQHCETIRLTRDSNALHFIAKKWTPRCSLDMAPLRNASR